MWSFIHEQDQELVWKDTHPSENKVNVIRLSSDILVGNSDADTGKSAPYFLFVGGRSQYRNFGTMLKAMMIVRDTRPEVRLAVTGSFFSFEGMKEIAELNLANAIKHFGYVDDQSLASLYQGSDAFIYPSLYEGSGMPLFEAMSCGTPVIASDSSSFPEVVGDAGILFNSTSIDNLVDAMLLLLDSPSSWDILINKGYKRLKLFSWDVAAAKDRNLYRSLAKT